MIFAGDITNQDECKTGNEYGCSDYGYTTPIDKETIIGIVGGIFGLIVFIIIKAVCNTHIRINTTKQNL